MAYRYLQSSVCCKDRFKIAIVIALKEAENGIVVQGKAIRRCRNVARSSRWAVIIACISGRSSRNPAWLEECTSLRDKGMLAVLQTSMESRLHLAEVWIISSSTLGDENPRRRSSRRREYYLISGAGESPFHPRMASRKDSSITICSAWVLVPTWAHDDESQTTEAKKYQIDTALLPYHSLFSFSSSHLSEGPS